MLSADTDPLLLVGFENRGTMLYYYFSNETKNEKQEQEW